MIRHCGGSAEFLMPNLYTSRIPRATSMNTAMGNCSGTGG